MQYVVFIETEEPAEGFPPAVTVLPAGSRPLLAAVRVLLDEGMARPGGTEDLSQSIAADILEDPEQRAAYLRASDPMRHLPPPDSK